MNKQSIYVQHPVHIYRTLHQFQRWLETFAIRYFFSRYTFLCCYFKFSDSASYVSHLYCVLPSVSILLPVLYLESVALVLCVCAAWCSMTFCEWMANKYEIGNDVLVFWIESSIWADRHNLSVWRRRWPRIENNNQNTSFANIVT